MDIDPFLGVSVKANLNSEIGRFGLIVRVGGSAGAPQAGAQDTPALLRAGHADTEARRSVLTALPCATLVTAGPQQAGAQDTLALLRAGRRETGPTRIRVVRRIREVRRALR